MATKLGLFNAALIELGHRPLADTGEEVEAGRVLNALYADAVEDCLTVGSWNFATETIKADADTGVTPEFGFAEVFAKPDDWLRTVAVSADENFAYPLTQYYDDQTFWSADVTPLYVRYVSDDTGMGLDLTRWGAGFRRFVELTLAERACLKVTQNMAMKEGLIEMVKSARIKALNQDAMDEAQPKFAPEGSWSRSRSGRSGERGSRSRLLG